jgi:hypothetical protein
MAVPDYLLAPGVVLAECIDFVTVISRQHQDKSYADSHLLEKDKIILALQNFLPFD